MILRLSAPVLWTLLVSSVAWAQTMPEGHVSRATAPTKCDAYVGKRITPNDVNVVASRLSSIRQEEFESNAAFHEREKPVRATLPAEAFFLVTPHEERFQYDAEKQLALFNILNFGFQLPGHYDRTEYQLFQTDSEYLHAELEKGESFLSRNREIVTGSYFSTNVFGAQINVKKVHQTITLLHDSSLINRDMMGTWQWQVEMSPQEARRVRPTLRTALLMDLSTAKGFNETKGTGPATFDDPRELKVTYAVLIGKIGCAVIVNPQSTVVYAFDFAKEFRAAP